MSNSVLYACIPLGIFEQICDVQWAIALLEQGEVNEGRKSAE